MMLETLLSEDIYRHKNGLKHINIVDNSGFSALFVVNTPIFDNSGVAHGVEHFVFRGSKAFPKPETLFQLLSLTDVKINASTLAQTTHFHCQSQCRHTFKLAINYLLNGLFNPVFTDTDLQYEIHDGDEKGVIYRELLGVEQAEKGNNKNSAKKDKSSEISYGGISTSIGELSVNDLTHFHQRFYQADNITLVTANADVKEIANLVASLPKPSSELNKVAIALEEYSTNAHNIDANEQDRTKYSPDINKLITLYHSWLQDPYYQEIDDYNEVESSSKQVVINSDTSLTSTSRHLIPALAMLSSKLVKEKDKTLLVNSNEKELTNKTVLPKLFSNLYEEAKNQLESAALSQPSEHAYVNDQSNGLWLAKINAEDKMLANIISYIISAYPKFLAHRYEGNCYATQALVIDNSKYLAIYCAFDVNPDTYLDNIAQCLLSLSQDDAFISMSLALAKIKYCRLYHVQYNQAQYNQVMSITSTQIATYLKNHLT